MHMFLLNPILHIKPPNGSSFKCLSEHTNQHHVAEKNNDAHKGIPFQAFHRMPRGCFICINSTSYLTWFNTEAPHYMTLISSNQHSQLKAWFFPTAVQISMQPDFLMDQLHTISDPPCVSLSRPTSSSSHANHRKHAAAGRYREGAGRFQRDHML